MKLYTYVKFLILLFWIGCLSNSTEVIENQNEWLQFGNVRIALTEGCNLLLQRAAPGVDTIKVDLPYPNICDFVRLQPYTNIVHAERYCDAWIVLIQCYKRVSQEEGLHFGCDTRYKALIILDDGRIFLNPETNGGSGCPPIQRDRHEFTYLAHSYVSRDCFSNGKQ